MSSLSATRRRNYSIATASAVLLIGATSLLFKTYPHLKPDTSKLFARFSCQTSSENTEDESKEPLSESTVVVPEKEVSQWTEEELTSYLKQKEVPVPENATIVDLVALVNQTRSA